MNFLYATYNLPYRMVHMVQTYHTIMCFIWLLIHNMYDTNSAVRVCDQHKLMSTSHNKLFSAQLKILIKL